MKNLLIFSWTLLFASLANAQINFFEGTFDQAIQKAEKEGKLVFVDAFTTWCGPCKMMSKNIFPLKAVGEFYNENFINMKIDMEKGEGPTIAAKYQVSAYPTYLFISSDKELMHKALGYLPEETFINAGKDALNPEKQFALLERKYNSGDRDPKFLKSFAYANRDLMNGKQGKVAETYLATQQDWSSEENMDVIIELIDDVRSKPFQYMLDNKSKFDAKYTKETVDATIQDRVSNTAQQMMIDGKGNANAMKEVDNLFVKFFPKNHERYQSSFKMSWFANTGDFENYAKYATQYLKNPETESPEELNQVAWTFYEFIEDKNQLNQALSWALLAHKKTPNYYNADTVAALYYKLGKKSKAKKMAKKAIAMAKEAELDYSETENLLKKIKG